VNLIDRILSSLGLVPAPEPPTLPPHIYKIGGSWGDAIEWRDVENGLVVGWKCRIPYVGDVLMAPMKSGRIGRYRFLSIKRKYDPPDMFFGIVEFERYEDDAS
jgi:hypothetical protein